MVAVAVATATIAACAPEAPAPEEPTRCAAPIADPPGFTVTQSFDETGPGHIGIRRSLADARGHELHLFAGIPGDIGEGLPVAATVTLADGGIARLLGRERVWVLAWSGAAPCTPQAVLSVGMTRRAFLGLLCDVGVLGGAERAC